MHKKEIKYFFEDEILHAFIMHGYDELQYASHALQANKDIVKYAIIQSKGDAFKYASDLLKDNDEVVEYALQINPCNLKMVSERLKQNKDIVFDAVEKDGDCFQYAHELLKKDQEFILYIVSNIDKSQLCCLKYLDNTLKQNRQFLETLIDKNPYALKYMNEHLRSDPRFVLLAATKEPNVFLEATPSIRNNISGNNILHSLQMLVLKQELQDELAVTCSDIKKTKI